MIIVTISAIDRRQALWRFTSDRRQALWRFTSPFSIKRRCHCLEKQRGRLIRSGNEHLVPITCVSYPELRLIRVFSSPSNASLVLLDCNEVSPNTSTILLLSNTLILATFAPWYIHVKGATNFKMFSKIYSLYFVDNINFFVSFFSKICQSRNTPNFFGIIAGKKIKRFT